MTTPSAEQLSQLLPSAGLPRVNLMPPEIAEAAKFRRFQLAMGGAVAAAIVAVGFLYVHAHGGVASAQKEVDAARAQNIALQSRLAGLQSVRQAYLQVGAKEAMLHQAMGQEIRWSYYLTDLSLKVPDHVWLTNIQATESSTGLAGSSPGAQSASPLTPTGIGTVTMAGVAFSHDDVATWLDTLAREKGYANPYFTNATETYIGPRKTVTFSSSVVLTDDAKSGRYNAAGS